MVAFVTAPDRSTFNLCYVDKVGSGVGWVDIGIGTKGKWGFVVSLENVWEIAIKFL
jgi:hypothetical protein